MAELEWEMEICRCNWWLNGSHRAAVDTCGEDIKSTHKFMAKWKLEKSFPASFGSFSAVDCETGDWVTPSHSLCLESARDSSFSPFFHMFEDSIEISRNDSMNRVQEKERNFCCHQRHFMNGTQTGHTKISMRDRKRRKNEATSGRCWIENLLCQVGGDQCLMTLKEFEAL